MNDLELFSTRLPKGLKDKYKNYCKREGYNMQGLLAKVLKEWIDEKEATKKVE